MAYDLSLEVVIFRTALQYPSISHLDSFDNSPLISVHLKNKHVLWSFQPV